MSHSSKKAIYAAAGANFGISVAKMGAGFYTGSSAMLTEAVHSLVDTGNQGLILLGMKRAAIPADDVHPFGYGKELYFWTFLVAILIFALGAGVSLYEGIHKTLHPEGLTDAWVNYVVLVFGLILEGGSFYIALKEFILTKGDKGIIQAVQESKDPTLFTVLFEDAAAMFGLVVALIGVFVADYLQFPIADGIASICIGLILAAVAVFLAIECKSLLIGESADPEVVRKVEELAGGHKSITQVNETLTMHLSPADILLTISLDFEDSLSAADVERTVTELEGQIKQAFPKIKRIFAEAQSKAGHKKMRDG